MNFSLLLNLGMIGRHKLGTLEHGVKKSGNMGTRGQNGWEHGNMGTPLTEPHLSPLVFAMESIKQGQNAIFSVFSEILYMA